MRRPLLAVMPHLRATAHRRAMARRRRGLVATARRRAMARHRRPVAATEAARRRKAPMAAAAGTRTEVTCRAAGDGVGSENHTLQADSAGGMLTRREWEEHTVTRMAGCTGIRVLIRWALDGTRYRAASSAPSHALGQSTAPHVARVVHACPGPSLGRDNDRLRASGSLLRPLESVSHRRRVLGRCGARTIRTQCAGRATVAEHRPCSCAARGQQPAQPTRALPGGRPRQCRDNGSPVSASCPLVTHTQVWDVVRHNVDASWLPAHTSGGSS